MIINNTEFQNALENVKEPLTLSLSDLSAIMSSEEVNYNNTTIYDALNKLYERVRLLEDIHTYCDTYIRQQIKTKKEEFRQTIQEIERNADQFYESDRGIPVSFNWSSNQVQGRDGGVLQLMEYDNGYVRPKGTVSATTKNKTFSHECLQTPYSITITDGRVDATYYQDTATYIYDSVRILFESPKLINFISLNTSLNVSAGCIGTNDDETAVPLNSYFTPILSKGIVLDIILTQGESVDINIKKSRKDAFESYDTVSQPTNWQDLENAADTLDENSSSVEEKEYNRNISAYETAWEKING